MAREAIIVNGYAFYNANDAQLAETERKKVEYLRARLDTSNPDKVLIVLKKAIEDNIFKTPIGMDFLREIQIYLLEQCDYSESEVPAIPVMAQYNRQLRVDAPISRERIAPNQSKKPKEKVPGIYISVVLNILLVIAVIAMFVITLNSNNPNILNYEKALTDKYSFWADELDEKESKLREKERDLKIREAELIEKENIGN